MSDAAELTLFLCGDVMTGRGIDQLLPYPGDPTLHERHMRDAYDYVRLAERVHGRIERPVAFPYVWGDALPVLEHVRPAARIVNLETSITTSDSAVAKGINYRMHPRNLPVLTAAGIDCCVLANNHVFDWGVDGLLETLDALGAAGLAVAGAGRDSRGARAPAMLHTSVTAPETDVGPAAETTQAPGAAARILVFAFATSDCGVPSGWSARADRPGVHLLADLGERTVERIVHDVAAHRRAGDIVVASVHWGSNWGYAIPAGHRAFAHTLIERAGVDIVHGHSSHHPRALEVHEGRLVLYGCGDFINDYEGIGGYAEYRPDLVLMYLPTLEATSGRLLRLVMVPLQSRRLRLRTPSRADVRWLQRQMDGQCRPLGGRVRTGENGQLVLEAR